MTFDTASVAQAIKTVLEGVEGMGPVQFGAPLSVGPRVSAYVTIGKQISDVKTAGGTVFRDASYYVDLCYRLDGAEEAVELTLMAAVDALHHAVNLDKTLGGACHNTTIDAGLSDDPDYRIRAGKEFREFVVVLICRQYDSYRSVP